MKYDFVVIGGGSAGYAGARTASALGMKTCVIEGSTDVGGLCILRGCMPSKTLLESANRLRAIRHGEIRLHAGKIGFTLAKSCPQTQIDLDSPTTGENNWRGDFGFFQARLVVDSDPPRQRPEGIIRERHRESFLS